MVYYRVDYAREVFSQMYLCNFEKACKNNKVCWDAHTYAVIKLYYYGH